MTRDAKPMAHRVVVVGGGFGGLAAVRALRRGQVEVTLLDRRNFHLFQPLLYQVATSGLSPGEIATPLRAILKRRRDVRVVLAEATAIDLAERVVYGRSPGAGAPELVFPFDTLVVAAGARHSYFGRDDWRAAAPGMKTIEDALELRRRILGAFEAAEVEPDPSRRREWLTFLVIGGGPTGVEMAGQIAEIANDTLRRDFRVIDPRESRILLVEAADRILGAYDARLSRKAAAALAHLGVSVRTGFMVSDVTPGRVLVSADDQTEEIVARTIVWAAGVEASPLARMLGTASGAEVDRNGRVRVGPDLTLPGHPEVFAVGDMIQMSDPATGRPLPGIAPVAMQQGRHVAATIRARLAGDTTARPFRYRDKGSLATIGRLRAVGQLGRLRLSGLPAWLTWLFVHIMYLVGFQNRLLVLIRWTLGFVTRRRGARLITGPPGSGDDPAAPSPPP